MLSPPRPRSRSRWSCLLRPKWLAWHAFAVLAAAGMLWLGDWQLHRAEAGNELSWAYTFEWPLFAVLGAVFWVKTLKEELRTPGAGGQGNGGPSAGGQGACGPGAGGQETGGRGAGGQGAGDRGAETAAGTPGRPGTSPPAEGAEDSAGATAYAARLSAEVRHHGRWHGLR
jgi:hypothetical protein